MKPNLLPLAAIHGIALLCLSLAACDGDGMGAEDAGAPTAFELQVERGQSLYGSHCARCHGPMGEGTDRGPRVVGLDQGALPLDPPSEAMVRTTQFVTAGDVAVFASTNMPGDDPGSLTVDEYLAILAFDLFANGVVLEDALTLDSAGELVIPR